MDWYEILEVHLGKSEDISFELSEVWFSIFFFFGRAEAVVRRCSLTQVLSCEFCKIFRSTFFHRIPTVVASKRGNHEEHPWSKCQSKCILALYIIVFKMQELGISFIEFVYTEMSTLAFSFCSNFKAITSPFNFGSSWQPRYSILSRYVM